MTPAIEIYADESPMSVAWRAMPDAAEEPRDANRLLLAHYRDPQATRREKLAITDDSTYVVAASRSWQDARIR